MPFDIESFVDVFGGASPAQVLKVCSLPPEFTSRVLAQGEPLRGELVAQRLAQLLVNIDLRLSENGYDLPVTSVHEWFAEAYKKAPHELTALAEAMRDDYPEAFANKTIYLAKTLGLKKSKNLQRQHKRELKEIFGQYGIDQEIACAFTNLPPEHLHPEAVIYELEQLINVFCEYLTAGGYPSPDNHLPPHDVSKLLFSKARKLIMDFRANIQTQADIEYGRSENTTHIQPVRNDIIVKMLFADDLAKALGLEKLPPTLFGGNGEDGKMPYWMSTQLSQFLTCEVTTDHKVDEVIPRDTKQIPAPLESIPQHFMEILSQALDAMGYDTDDDLLPRYLVTALYQNRFLSQQAINLVYAYHNGEYMHTQVLESAAAILAQHFGLEKSEWVAPDVLDSEPPHPYDDDSPTPDGGGEPAIAPLPAEVPDTKVVDAKVLAARRRARAEGKS